jgi:cytochrome P450
VLSILLLERDEAGGLTDQQVRDEVMTLLLAGHETTANALTWTWFELGRHPDVLARLVLEIDALGKREITVDDLPQLPFNLAVIEEAMRMHPPAYMTGRQATRDVVLGAHHLLEGAIVAINIRGIHRRADYFPAPDALLPERMLDDSKKARPAITICRSEPARAFASAPTSRCSKPSSRSRRWCGERGCGSSPRASSPSRW